MSKTTKAPDRIWVSKDRQWAKSRTPICTEEYVRAPTQAGEGEDGLVDRLERLAEAVRNAAELLPLQEPDWFVAAAGIYAMANDLERAARRLRAEGENDA